MKTIQIILSMVFLVTTLEAEDQSAKIHPIHERERPTFISICQVEFKGGIPDGIIVLRNGGDHALTIDKDTTSVYDAIEKSGPISRVESPHSFAIHSPIDGSITYWRGPKFYSPEERKKFLSRIILRRGEILSVPQR